MGDPPNDFNRMRGPTLPYSVSLIRHPAWFRSLTVLFFLVFCLPASRVLAQRGAVPLGALGGSEPAVTYPSPDYYTGLLIYRDGDLESAVRAFESANRRTRRDPTGQWIDAIPVYAMLAECYWHLGDMASVRESVDRAMKIAVRYRGWLAQPVWESVLNSGAQPARLVGLWPEAAAVKRLPVKQQIMFRSGMQLNDNNLARLPSGATFEEANIKSVDVPEIMRGLAIASYRRRMLMGPLSDQDSLTVELVDATKYPAGLQLPIARTLIGAMRGSEKFSAAKTSRRLKTQGPMLFSAAAPIH